MFKYMTGKFLVGVHGKQKKITFLFPYLMKPGIWLSIKANATEQKIKSIHILFTRSNGRTFVMPSPGFV